MDDCDFKIKEIISKDCNLMGCLFEDLNADDRLYFF
jgi:hypothetical protein